jgi:FkbM family methyltransferase
MLGDLERDAQIERLRDRNPLLKFGLHDFQRAVVMHPFGRPSIVALQVKWCIVTSACSVRKMTALSAAGACLTPSDPVSAPVHTLIKRIKSFSSKARFATHLLRSSGWRQWCSATRTGNTSPIAMRVRGHSIDVRPATPDLRVAIKSLGTEFQPLFSAVPRLTYNFIVDAGGYIGTAAIALAAQYPGATIVSLEPFDENFALLKRNTSRYPNIVPLQMALADKDGTVVLKDRGTGPWGLTIVDMPSDNPNSRRRGEVPSTTPAQLMVMFGANGIDILKLDIEGAEHSLFTSEAIGWIDQTTAIFVELHDRISPGCSSAFHDATRRRINCRTHGEKFLSLLSLKAHSGVS